MYGNRKESGSEGEREGNDSANLKRGMEASMGMKFRVLTPAELIGPLNDLERKYAPKALYVQGPMEIPLPGPRASIVGTRKPSHQGTEATRSLARFLVKSRAVVVSGLAEGIDTTAHKTAIDEGGQTIAVLGTPLNSVYPKMNAELQQFIAEHHLAITQFEPGHRTWRSDFIARNRTMALISDATFIVEAGEKSGSRHQGWEAIRLGRPLFLHRSIVEDSSLTWPKQMSRYGAVPFEEPEEVIEVLPSPRQLIEMNALV